MLTSLPRPERDLDSAANEGTAAAKTWSLEQPFPREEVAKYPDLVPLYDRYISQINCSQSSGGIVIKVPTSFHAKGLQVFKSTLEKIAGQSIVSIEVEQRERSRENVVAMPAVKQQQVALSLPPLVNTASNEDQERKRRLPAPSLIRSPSFEMPIQLAERWANGINLGMRCQALWVHGVSGSGKSWLLKQLHEWVGFKTRIITIDVISFFHEWRRALESKETLGFIKKFRKDVDLLVLENLDDLQGKVGTQQELLFTINAILDRGASVAVSSTLHPMQLRELLEPSLFSRLFSGLALEMPRPDRPFKEHLWRHLVDQYGLKDWPMDLMLQERLFAIKIDTARKAHTLFINAIGRLSLKGTLSVVDIAELEQSHGSVARTLQSQHHNPSELVEKVARLCGVGPSAIQGKVRRSDVSLARRFVCLALSRFLGLTNSAISMYVEKDPSTVCHALKSLEVDLERDRHIAEQWNWICGQLGQPNK